LGPHGENLLNTAAYALAHHDLSIRMKLGEGIRRWSERSGLKNFCAGPERNVIRASFKDLDAVLDLAMGSFGSRQVATMITQLIVTPRRSVVMVEEPELCLHPEAQTLLPLLFADEM